MTSLYIHRLPDLVRVLLLEDKRPVELHVAPKSPIPAQGTVVSGRILRIVPSLCAAFVDIGQDLPGFLPWQQTIAYGQQADPNKVSMGQLYQPGQRLVLQIHHQSQGNKGAKLQEQLQFPGRYVLWSPHGQRSEISRKLRSHPHYGQLQAQAQQLQQQLGGSLLLRTAAAGIPAKSLAQDAERCQAAYQQVEQLAQSSKPGQILASPGDLGQWAIRELWQPSRMELWVNDAHDLHIAQQQLACLDIGSSPRLHDWPSPAALPAEVASWHTYLQQALARVIRLPGGAWLAIEPTEGMLAIDINAGRHQSRSNREETAWQINRLACREIARQLRLRNIGGLCVVDFITMERQAHREQLVHEMEQQVQQDRLPVRIEPLGQHCVMVMHRKRTSSAIYQQVPTSCPTCQDQGGLMPGWWLAALSLEQMLREHGAHPHHRAIVPVEAYQALCGPLASSLQQLYDTLGKPIAIGPQLDKRNKKLLTWESDSTASMAS